MKIFFKVFVLIQLTGAVANSAVFDSDIPYEDNDNSYVTVKKQIGIDPDFNVLEKVNVKELAIPPCIEVSLELEQCYQAICYESMPFGKVYRKIRGENKDGDCEYIERTPGVGGRDCTFKKAEAKEFSEAVSKYYSYVLNPTKRQDSEVVKNTVKVLDSKCKIVKDSALTNIITIKTPIEQKGQDPELLLTDEQIAMLTAQRHPAAKIPDSSIKPVGQVDAAKSDTRTLDTLVNHRSFMLTQDEVEKIDNVLKGLGKDSQAALGVLDSGGIGFYLNSVMYYGKDQWVIWVNGKKYLSQDSSLTELSILDVAPNEVQMIWTTQGLDKQAANWKRRLIPVKDNLYSSEDNRIQVEIAGNNKELVRFSLKPNQTMNVNTMSITEGNNG